MTDWKNDLLRELDEWNFNGEDAEFWWRDDDAVELSEQLTTLLNLADRFDIPVALAVIPAMVKESLAMALDDRSGKKAKVEVLIHGYQHLNHAPEGQKKQELTSHYSLGNLSQEISEARNIIENHFASVALPVMVPPWNRIDPEIFSLLLQNGITGLSTFNPRQEKVVAEGYHYQLWQVNTHVDVIDWKNGRTFKSVDDIALDIIRHLQMKRIGVVDATEATGLLTHHLVHSEAGWEVLESLLNVMDDHPAVKWLSANQVFQLKTMEQISSDPEMDANAYDPLNSGLPFTAD